MGPPMETPRSQRVVSSQGRALQHGRASPEKVTDGPWAAEGAVEGVSWVAQGADGPRSPAPCSRELRGGAAGGGGYTPALRHGRQGKARAPQEREAQKHLEAAACEWDSSAA